MRFIIPFLLVVFCLFSDFPLLAQKVNNPGRFSGDLQFNGRVYDTDSLIDAVNTPFYDNLKSSADAWFSLNYNRDGLDVGMRFDMFNNTGIFSGLESEANGMGIGMWYARKKMDKLTIQVGYIYDQFGSGTTFRAYENRSLAIDNPIVGVWGKYQLTDDIFIKGFTGKQKNLPAFISENRRFVNVYPQFLKGVNTEGYFSLKKGISISPGVSLVNRTLDRTTMNQIASEINQLEFKDRFIPKYNVFAYSVYTTLNIKRFNLYLEYAGKSEDALRNLEGNLFGSTGSVAFAGLTYSQKGLGITSQIKKIDNFDFKTTPNVVATGGGTNTGVINFLPPQTRQNSLRLLARYASNTQVLDEFAYQIAVTTTPKKGLTFNFNFSNVVNGNNLFPDDSKDLLYREIYLDFEYRKRKSPLKILGGVQFVDYNIDVLQEKPGKDNVHTFVPFTEFIYKIDRKKSVRMELQYMMTKRNYRMFGKDDPASSELQDLGDWLYGLVEFSIAPKFAISASDMYSIDTDLHYYDFSTSYTNKANRFAIGYVRQVSGIICTGGVCRFENTFSGLKASITSSF